MAHTKGPWHYGKVANHYGDHDIYELATGKSLALVRESRDNALLMSLAPEMLEALVKAGHAIEQLCNTVNTLAGRRKVRTADFNDYILALIARTKED